MLFENYFVLDLTLHIRIGGSWVEREGLNKIYEGKIMFENKISYDLYLIIKAIVTSESTEADYLSSIPSKEK